MADTHFNRRIFQAFSVKLWTVLVQIILSHFCLPKNDSTSPTFPLLPCRDARFCADFPASCLMWCGIAPLSCRDAKFLFVFPASRYYMGQFCSEMEHDAKFCADFFASCPVCLSGSVFFWGGLNGGMDYTILKTPVSYSSKPSERYRARAAVRDGFDVKYSDGFRSQPVVDSPVACSCSTEVRTYSTAACTRARPTPWPR